MSSSSPRASAPPANFWKRFMLWAAPVCVILAIIGFFIAKMAINAYLHSDGFRQFVAHKAGATLRAQCELAPLQFNGLNLYTEGFKATGSAEAPFAVLSLDQVRAEISLRRFFEHVWQVEQVEVQRVQVNLDGPRTGMAEAIEHAPSESPAKPGWLPSRVEIGSAAVRDTHLIWKDGALHGSALKITPADGGWEIAAQNGRIDQVGVPSFDVQNLRLRCRGDSIFITEAVFRQGSEGMVKTTGEVVVGQHVDLQNNLDNMALTPFLSPDWRLRLKGNVSGELTVRTSLPVPLAGIPISGSLKMAHGELTALPVLDQIALFTGTQQFRRLVLSRAEADFRQDGAKLRVSKFVMESEGLICVEGAFTVENSLIDGTFQVGVTPAALQWLPGSRTKVFVDARGGYVWTPMRLTGPVDKPTEDLTPRLIAALQGAVIEGAQNAVQEGVKTGKDAVKGVLDLVLPGVK